MSKDTILLSEGAVLFAERHPDLGPPPPPLTVTVPVDPLKPKAGPPCPVCKGPTLDITSCFACPACGTDQHGNPLPTVNGAPLMTLFSVRPASPVEAEPECAPVSDDPVLYRLEMAHAAACRGMTTQEECVEIEKWISDAMAALGDRRIQLRKKHEEAKAKANGGM